MAPIRVSLVFRACSGAAIAISVSALSACGPLAKQAAAPSPDVGSRPSDANPSFITPARWFASVASADATGYGTSRGGGKLVIVQGLRLEQAPDGSLERAAEFLPSTDAISAVELPARFGGGYLYYVPGEETPLWRAGTWTGKLVPLARVPLQADSVVPGLNRLYLSEERSGEMLALDLESGQPTDLGPLPAAPAYGSMAFVDGWFGAVEVPYLGIVATFDAGDSWHPLRLEGLRVALMRNELVLRGTSQDLVLEPSGRLHPLAFQPKLPHLEQDESAVHPSRSTAPARADSRLRAPTRRIRDTLRKATLYGWPDTSSTAVFAEGGALARIRLSDGKVLEVAERVFGREGGACRALALGDDFGFVCNEPDSATTVYRFVRPLGAERVFGFPEPRQVMSSGNGSLVIRGPCNDGAKQDGSRASAPSFCVWGPKTGLQELPVRGDPRVLRAVALRDGRAVVLTPPRPREPGTLVLFEDDGHSSSRRLRPPSDADASTRALLDSAFWLDGAVETPEGKLGLWLVGSKGYAGIRVELDGSVSVGPSQDATDQTLFAGLLAFGFADNGTAKESVDGGLSWKGLELPPGRLFPEPNERRGGTEAGCSRIGCAFGAWLRVGWLAPARGSSGLAQAPMPKPALLPAPAGGRWNFECAVTGARSPPRLPASKNRGSEDDGTGPTEAWRPLYGSAPRALGQSSLGFGHNVVDRGTELGAYVWGPRGASWQEAGRWQIFVAPAAAVSRPVWSTSISRSPWDDPASAAEAFGRSPSGSASSWSVEMEPSGEAGILRSAAPNGVKLYLFERSRSIVPVLDAPSGASRLLGVAKVGDRWYFGVKGGSVEFMVYALQDSRAELLAKYSELSRRLEPRLVRDSRSRSLAIWAKDTKLRGAATSWYLYPLDAKNGLVSEPLVLSPRMLGAAPRPCDPDFEGWVLDGEPPVQPLVLLTDASDDSDTPRAVSARLLAGAQGVCVAGLRARADGDATSGMRPMRQGPNPTRPSTVLALESTEPTGRRSELRCVE